MFLKCLIAMLPMLLVALGSMAQGLSFQSTVNSIEKRTSYDVFGGQRHTFRHVLDIRFEMRLPLREDVGYVVRVTDGQRRQAYNMFYDGRGNDYFALNEEGNKVLLLIRFDRAKLRAKQWFTMGLRFDLDKKTITLDVDGQARTVSHANLPDAISPNIIFGRSDYLIDVPTFSMRELSVADGDREWLFPLRQATGERVYDSKGAKTGNVINPYWLLNDHYRWKKVFASASKTPAGYNYDERRHTLLYYNRDVAHLYDITANRAADRAFASPCPVRLWLGTGFIDAANDRLYTYEVFREGKGGDEPSVASLDLRTFAWRTESATQVNEGPMHHHAAWFDGGTGEFTIYGGFANMRYHSTFYTYSTAERRWAMRDDITGKRFPRYFLTAGYDGKRYVYMFGGMGNESGDQTVGRVFYYDLHRLDTRTGKLVKLWNADFGDGNDRLVFSKGMVINGDSFYTLGYSEYLSDSSLKLFRFSIRDGSWQMLGDSIPIHPNRIESEANLFYDRLLRRFVATVMEYGDKDASTFRAYVLSSPALSEEAFAAASVPPSRPWLWVLWLLVAVPVVVVSAAVVLVRRRRRRAVMVASAVGGRHGVERRANSVCLFGEFLATDRSGKDITYMFTDKLKVIFCLVLQHSAEGGISSRYLGNLVWGDKAPEKIKNSRSVALNHLRRVLGEMDGVTLVYESGKYCLRHADPFRCDFLRMSEIIAEGGHDPSDRAEMREMLARGKFLLGMDTPLLDGFKSEVENMLMPVLKAVLGSVVAANDAQGVLDCAKAIFNIDPADEEAYMAQMRMLKRTGQTLAAFEAQVRYRKAAGGDGRER